MHVGLNLIFLVPGETGGMEIYARELLQRIDAAARRASGGAPVRFTAFVNRAAAGGGPRGWGQGIDEVVVPVDSRDRKQWVWGEQRHLPSMAARAGCDIVHSLASTAPLRGRFARITTIHDLNYKLVPESHFGVRGRAMAMLVPAAARRSQRILVDAASTRDDLAEHLGTDRAKVDVVPLGVAEDPHADPTDERDLRRRFHLGDRHVLLSVSAKRPHKNLLRLLEAHAALGEAHERPMLVIPGYPTEHESELIARCKDLGTTAEVRFPGWLQAADLEGLYALADAFVFPSLYEGFGLPVLEAMARGVPVATSGRASLAEVAGDAALLFDPESVDEIRAGLQRLLTDDALRDRLRREGRERAATFTWDRTAELTFAAYRRALAAR
ncbi:glycosyltransferase family 4 protein [Paraconexibacter sp.]|uniref:glycosyltransferase family 4 protein n=1 Tax=Paraconexibacter sp. TaxID=2949640 RepID=UPI00356A0A4A